MNSLTKVFQSHHLQSATYDPTTQSLHIEFVNGARGVYQNVPPRRWEELSSATSPGSYLHKFIRPFYPFQRKDQ
jgi:hypothetical protein